MSKEYAIRPRSRTAHIVKPQSNYRLTLCEQLIGEDVAIRDHMKTDEAVCLACRKVEARA